MGASLIAQPFPFFNDSDGDMLEAGKIYIGSENLNPETNPIAVFWDDGLTEPANLPIRTVAGFPDRNGNISNFFVGSRYSITVRDRNGELVYSSLSEPTDSLANSTTLISSDLIGYDLGVTGSVERTLTTKLNEIITPEDFGAVGDGVTDDTTAVQAAITYALANPVTLQCDNNYLLSSTITGALSANVHIKGRGKFIGSVANQEMFYFTNTTYDFRLEGITIDGVNSNHRGLRMDQAAQSLNRVYIENITVKNFYTSIDGDVFGIMIRGGYQQVSLLNSKFENFDRVLGATAVTQAALIRSDNTATYFPISVVVSGCFFKNITNEEVTDNAFNVDMDALAVFGKITTGNDFMKTSISISNCHVVNSKGRGIKIQGDRVSIVGCHFYRNIAAIDGWGDINCQITSGMVSNCTFMYEDEDSGEATGIREGVPIGMFTGADRSRPRLYNIDNCIVYDNRAVLTDTGVFVQSGVGYAVDTDDNEYMINITNCHSRGMHTAFVELPPYTTATSDPSFAVASIRGCSAQNLVQAVYMTNIVSQQNLIKASIIDFVNWGTPVQSSSHLSTFPVFGGMNCFLSNTYGVIDDGSDVDHRDTGFHNWALTGKPIATDVSGARTGLRVYDLALLSQTVPTIIHESYEIPAVFLNGSCMFILTSTYGRTTMGVFVAESTGSYGVSELPGTTLPATVAVDTDFTPGANPNQAKLNIWVDFANETLNFQNQLGSFREVTVAILGI